MEARRGAGALGRGTGRVRVGLSGARGDRLEPLRTRGGGVEISGEPRRTKALGGRRWGGCWESIGSGDQVSSATGWVRNGLCGAGESTRELLGPGWRWTAGELRRGGKMGGPGGLGGEDVGEGGSGKGGRRRRRRRLAGEKGEGETHLSVPHWNSALPDGVKCPLL